MKWKIHFSDIDVVTNPCGTRLREDLSSKIKYHERRGHIFSHISEMTITFLSNIRDMTYETYLERPKSMLEWRLIMMLAKDPQLVKKLGNSSHPLIRKYLFDDDGDVILLQ